MAVNPSARFDTIALIGQSFRKAAQASPSEFRVVFERLRGAYPEEVAKLSVSHIAYNGLDEIGRRVALWLCNNDLYLAPLLDPKLLSIDAARSVLEIFRSFDAQFSPKFSKLLSLENRDSDAFMLPRALELLIGLRNYEVFFPHLQVLARSSDVYVRSKAVKALCRIRPNKSLIERHSQCEDSRVRANALEAIWHIKTDEAKSILEASVGDEDHRVALNALVGLYFLDEPSALERMLQLAEHDSIRFRRAVVWAFGLIADPRAKGALEKMLSDPSPVIQTNARRALAKLPAEPSETGEIPRDLLDFSDDTVIPTEAPIVEVANEQPVEPTHWQTPSFKVL